MVAPGAKKTRLDSVAQLAHLEALTLVEEKFRDFDVVWAKVHGFPWWPGVLFHSWDVVRSAGISTDPKIVASLVVPPPEKVPVYDAICGKDTGAFRVRRYCLVMFLDKFNFSLVEIEPSSVASFTIHYHMYEHAVLGNKSSKWFKKKAEFRRALVKATQLLHIGTNYEESELELLKEPSTAEKKRRMDDVRALEEEKAWNEGDATVLPSQKEESTKMPTKNIKAVKVRTIDVEDKDSGNGEDDVLTARKAWPKAPAKELKSRTRRASRKDVDNTHVAIVSRSPSPINEVSKEASISTLKGESAKTKRSKSARSNRAGPSIQYARERRNKRNREGTVDQSANIAQEEEPNSPVRTPLSSIWTTGVSDDSTTESSALAYKQDLVWDDDVFTDDLSFADKIKAARDQAEEDTTGLGRERSLGKRQSRSVQQSQIRQNLMTGNLDPHTMVQCSVYRSQEHGEDLSNRSRGGATLDPPFQVVVHPDAVFVADLHAHLATCEIIGFLGGKWDEMSKKLYIQAAFPCRSLVIDGDDGSTDVEMDPGSEIELRGIIEDAQLEVVGWYHSHPAFAPDPSVRDIENQTSYQQLFQRSNTNVEANGESNPVQPFVGLIVGTYDTRRSSSLSLFRYFHTRSEKVSGGARREVYVPYEFVPRRRHFRSVLQDEERERTKMLPMYHSVLQHFKIELNSIRQMTTDIRSVPASYRLSPSRTTRQGPAQKGNDGLKISRKKSIRAVRSLSKDYDVNNNLESSGNPLVSPHESQMVQDSGVNVKTETKAILSNSNGVTFNDSKVAKDVESSIRSCSGDSSEKVTSTMTGDADVDSIALISESSNAVETRRKRSRKDQNPKRVSGHSSSADAVEHSQLLADHIVEPELHEQTATTQDPEILDVSANTTCLLSLPNSVTTTVESGGLSLPSDRISGRKRPRKPEKTTRNSHWSSLPIEKELSVGIAPVSNNQVQAMRFRFNAGPCGRVAAPYSLQDDPKCRIIDKNTSHSYVGRKRGNASVENLKYFVLEEGMNIPSRSSQYKVDNTMTNSDDDLINQEVRNSVQFLVESTEQSAEQKLSSEEFDDKYKYNDPVNGGVKLQEKRELKLNQVVDITDRTVPQRFGLNGEHEDIQTSLQNMAGNLRKLHSSQNSKSTQAVAKHQTDTSTIAKHVVVKFESDQAESHYEQDHLMALRTKYGLGVRRCAEQVIALVDYYRDFDRRIDLNEIWKSRITKLEKIENSLSEYVQFLNIPAALRQDFIKDLISYLRKSWQTKDRCK